MNLDGEQLRQKCTHFSVVATYLLQIHTIRGTDLCIVVECMLVERGTHCWERILVGIVVAIQCNFPSTNMLECQRSFDTLNWVRMARAGMMAVLVLTLVPPHMERVNIVWMDHRCSRLDTHKLDYDSWHGRRSQCRTNSDMDQRISDGCTLYPLDIHCSQHIPVDIVVVFRWSQERTSTQLVRRCHGNLSSVRMAMASMPICVHLAVARLVFHGIARTDHQLGRAGKCRLECDWLHGTKRMFRKCQHMDQRTCIAHRLIDRHNLHWFHIHDDSRAPCHMDCPYRNQASNSMHRLHSAHDTQHSIHMVMVRMVLTPVQLVLFFGLWGRAICIRTNFF